MSITPLILLALLLIPAPQAQQGLKPTAIVEREVELLERGLFILNDTITVKNPPPGLSALSIGQPSDLKEERCAFYLYSEGISKPLEFDVEEVDQKRWFLVHLPKPVKEDILRLKASYLYVDEVMWRDGDYQLTIPLTPILARDIFYPMPWNITSLNFTVHLPEGSEVVEVESPLPVSNSSVDGLWTLTLNAGPFNPLKPLNITVVYVPPPGEEQLITLESMIMRVRIGAWRLKIEEDYTLINRGEPLERLHLELPPEARGVRARDRAGPLRVRSRVSEGGVDVYVHPRTTVGSSARWSFTLIYTLPKGKFITRSGSRYTLRYLISDLPCYISSLYMEALLPGGAFPISHQPQGEVERLSPISYRVSFNLGGIAPFEEAVISVDYRWTPFWLLFRPMLWGFLILAVSAVLLIAGRKRVEVEVEERPTFLEEFLKLYDRRVSLLLELEELEEALERREIGRERFERGSAEAHRRLMELSRRLKRLETRLEEEQPELMDRLEDLKGAEEELERAMAALRGLERRLRRRRISRRDYVERRREHVGRRRKAIRKIEEALAAIKGSP